MRAPALRTMAATSIALALTLTPMTTTMNAQAQHTADPSKPAQSAAAPSATHAHVVNSFHFEVIAPMSRVAPLFAPEAERAWAGENWNPIFLYPQPGRDIQGAVWTIQHGDVHSVWVNTLFDIPNGRMQYVAFIPGHMVTTVEVHVTPINPTRTAVEVIYTRTALDPAANADVQARGKADRLSGPEWQQGIEAALSIPRPEIREQR